MVTISEEYSQYFRKTTNEEFSPNYIAQMFKYSTKVIIWSVMSAQGTKRLYIVEGMMNQ